MNFTGILDTAGIQTQPRGSDPQVDAIYKAVVKIRLQFMEPDGIVLHPNDWRTIRLTKDSNGNYSRARSSNPTPTGCSGCRSTPAL